MVGNAVGIRTVSSATRNIDTQSAVYASKTERSGPELDGTALATSWLLTDDDEDFSAHSGNTVALAVESSVRDVCLDDRSEGMAEPRICSGPGDAA